MMHDRAVASPKKKAKAATAIATAAAEKPVKLKPVELRRRVAVFCRRCGGIT